MVCGLKFNKNIDYIIVLWSSIAAVTFWDWPLGIISDTTFCLVLFSLFVFIFIL